MNENNNMPSFTPDVVSRLFKLSLENDSPSDNLDDDYKRTVLLRDLLDDIPPLRGDLFKDVPTLLRQLHEALPRLEGKSLGQLLHDPKTSIDELRTAKDYAKQVTKSAHGDIEYEVAGVVYYGAIAAALLHHEIRITQHSFKQLGTSFDALVGKDWIVPELKDLFRRAKEVCNKSTDISDA